MSYINTNMLKSPIVRLLSKEKQRRGYREDRDHKIIVDPCHREDSQGHGIIQQER